MKIRIIKKNVKSYESKLMSLKFTDAAQCFSEQVRGHASSPVDLDLNCNVTLELIEAIKKIALKIDDNYAVADCNVIIPLINDPNNTRIKSLRGFIKAFELNAKKSIIDGWIYQLDLNGNHIPHLIYEIEHCNIIPEYEIPERVKIHTKILSSKPVSSRDKSYFYFEIEHVYGKSLSEAIGSKFLFLENKALKSAYELQIDTYNKHLQKLGSLFLSKSSGLKLINDQFNNSDMPSAEYKSCTKFFNDSRINNLDDYHVEDIQELGEDLTERVISDVPFHPYIKMFDLENHCTLWEPTYNLTEYQYDSSASDKLILPNNQRDLIDILVGETNFFLEDIVSSKSTAASILCKGKPGLGKKLTAEVYSQIVRKPLYQVHSDQLGTDPSDIDGKLKTILERSARWGAVLLLNEVDIYIRKRDNSIQHNAIVTSFLRRLESFGGIVFMTTNRSDDVDDAILDKCTAVITYNYPGDEDLHKIWVVLSDHYKIPMSSELIDQVISLFENMSGRDIKGLLKLMCKHSSGKDAHVDVDAFRKLGMFRNLTFKNGSESNLLS